MDFAIFLLWLIQRIVSGWLQLKFIALTDLYNCVIYTKLLRRKMSFFEERRLFSLWTDRTTAYDGAEHKCGLRGNRAATGIEWI